MPIIDIRGVPHTYELTAPTGNSIALVFIHGWLLSRGYWRLLIEKLAPHYQCLSYDLRGFGDSNQQANPDRSAVERVTNTTAIAIDPSLAHLPTISSNPLDERAWVAQSVDARSPLSFAESRVAEASSVFTASRLEPRSSYTPAAYAHDVVVLLQELGIQQAWLVGHSLGGSIALWGADMLPECVKGVICVNAGGGIYLKEEFERFRAAGQQLLRLRPRWLCYLPLIDLLFTRASVARTIDRCWGRQRVIDFVMAHPEAALGTLLDSTTEEEVHRLPQVVSRLKQPVYFLAGAQDPIMEPKYVRHLASFHPLFGHCGENVVEIPNCGHMAMVEQPDLVAEQIQTLIQSH